MSVYRYPPTTVWIAGGEPILVAGPLVDDEAGVDPDDWARYQSELAAANERQRAAARPTPAEQHAEDARRARLYDALWQVAYHNAAGVSLHVVGTHDTTYQLWLGQKRVASGELADVEQAIAALAANGSS